MTEAELNQARQLKKQIAKFTEIKTNITKLRQNTPNSVTGISTGNGNAKVKGSDFKIFLNEQEALAQAQIDELQAEFDAL